MALAEFSRQTQYVVEECCHEGCNCLFAMTLDMYNRRKADKKGFYCPNGHKQFYLGETEAERLKRELQAKERDLEWQRAQRLREERRSAAARGQVTKIKNRISNGVCPCCKRSFQNFKQHMSHMHPDFKKEETQ